MTEEINFENVRISNFKGDLDLGSGHMAYCHASFVEIYLHAKFHSNQKTFSGQTYIHI